MTLIIIIGIMAAIIAAIAATALAPDAMRTEETQEQPVLPIARTRMDSTTVGDLREAMERLGSVRAMSDLRECDEGTQCLRAEYHIGEQYEPTLTVMAWEDDGAATAQFERHVAQRGEPAAQGEVIGADGSAVGRYAAYGTAQGVVLDATDDIAVDSSTDGIEALLWTNGRMLSDCKGLGCATLFVSGGL